MVFALNLIASGVAEVEWSRTLMTAWLAIVLALSVIEVWLMSGRSDRPDGAGPTVGAALRGRPFVN